MGAGEAAFAVAEQLAFDEVFGDGGAVHLDEGLGGALADGVDGVGDQFLAGAAFAEDQHAAVGAGHQGELLAQRLHGNAFADDAWRLRPSSLKRREFEFQAALLQGVLDDDA